MKQVIKYIVVGTLWCACTSRGSSVDVPTKPNNYVVILDLSDRLVNPNQTDIDTSVIRACFERLETAVQRNLTVKSKDKFCVRIIPQQNSTLAINQFENSLALDLSSFTAAEKLNRLKKFKEELGTTIKHLYQQAFVGNKTTSYFGIDIYQYFKDQLNRDIDSNYKNKVVLLTDGYFDFEDKTRGISTANRSTVTTPLLANMEGLDWKMKAEKDSVGIIPVNLLGEPKFIIVGIQSKTPNDLLETEKLSYLWEKWIHLSGGGMPTPPIANASSGKIKSLIKATL